jgi:hypothetical protein
VGAGTPVSQVGDFPRAFTHLALIGGACALDGALGAEEAGP